MHKSKVVVPQEDMLKPDALLAAVEEKYYRLHDSFTLSFDEAGEVCADYSGDIPPLGSDITFESASNEDGYELEFKQS